jgi:hypothetical protein
MPPNTGVSASIEVVSNCRFDFTRKRTQQLGVASVGDDDMAVAHKLSIDLCDFYLWKDTNADLPWRTSVPDQPCVDCS